MADPGRVVEIVGDSISAGFGNLGSETHPGYGPDPTGGCGFTTDTESAYLTYGAVAARALGIEVIVLRRPPAPEAPAVETIEEAVAWLDHALTLAAARGV